MAEIRSLAVWVGPRKVGRLERAEDHTFAYRPEASPSDAVSLTMPVRLKSWQSRDLHPVFQMNLPEGALRIAVRSAIAKVAGTDDMTVLRVVGGNTIGRNRFSRPEDDAPMFPSEPESLEEILSFPDALELFNELVSRYALRSGVSGVQPKVLLPATERATAVSSDFIVKSWGADFPQLGANEFHCMKAARKAGLATPEFHLSVDGGLFVMKRFDTGADGASCGFEDFCSLQGLGTDGKYGGSYERVARSITEFVSPEHRTEARERFFGALVLSVAVRNGDAHLKNFGVLYDDAKGPVRITPIYDIVTTTAYLKNDVPALALGGRKIWWPRKALEKFAVADLFLPRAKANEIIDRVLDAVNEVREEVLRYMDDHPEFAPVGEGMLAAWRVGVDGLSTHRRKSP
ncbi:MAG: type II toxin-antitoxin system HipA family toxin [Deltaproteobacteria bacterium]|nr:MAG: type II toxin-antitoxin system HipA family toxin [Deltaproteobacteria bacterium]